MDTIKLKSYLRKAYGTSCYVCGMQKPRAADVSVMWFDEERSAGADDADTTYLACKTCASKIRKRPLAAYVTEQRARCAVELARLQQIELWHSVGREMRAVRESSEIRLRLLEVALAQKNEPAPRIRDQYSDDEMRGMLETAKASGMSKRVFLPIWARANSIDDATSNAAMTWLIELCDTERTAAE